MTTWPEIVDELEGRGFTVETLEHALTLAAQRLADLPREPLYDDGQRIVRWARDHAEG